jgi:protein SCO1/2
VSAAPSVAPLQGADPARRRAALRLLLGSAAALALTAAVLWLSSRAPEPPPRLGALPDFALVTHRGEPIGLAELAGRPFVADFIFTRCAGICPGMTARMAQLQRRLDPGVRLVSFTVDPEHDTPAALSRYAREAGAGAGWFFVTGARAELYRLATDGFKLAAMEVPQAERAAGGDGPFLHSSKFVLVDGGAQIRGYYDSEDPAALARLAEHAGRLAAR